MIIIYTANFGNYDKVLEPIFKDHTCRYILFTDRDLRSNFWEVVKVNLPSNSDTQRIARYYKLNPHKVLPAHDYSIWVDSCIKIKKFLFKDLIINNIGEVICYKHPVRNCLYEEARVCANLQLDYKHIIESQIERYRNLNFPENKGLFDTAIMVRQNKDSVNQFNEFWWEEVKNGSRRDQLSQMFASWKTGVIVNNFKIGVSKMNSPYFRKKKHLRERKKYV